MRVLSRFLLVTLVGGLHAANTASRGASLNMHGPQSVEQGMKELQTPAVANANTVSYDKKINWNVPGAAEDTSSPAGSPVNSTPHSFGAERKSAQAAHKGSAAFVEKSFTGTDFINTPEYHALVNRAVIEDISEKSRLYAQHNQLLETVENKNFLLRVPVKYAIAPWLLHYGKNKTTYDALTKFMVLGSAAAFMFNKFGGTEYVRNKIREMFDKPPIYSVRRRKAGYFGGSKKYDLISEKDVVMNPATRKQINELIYLLRRRYEMSKTSGSAVQKTKRKVLYPYPTLFYGPPGTGKTTIATMIADQSVGDNGSPMNFISLMASDFMQIKHEGDRLAVLKDMFEKANKMGNTIIFLDEIDGMVQQRGVGDTADKNRAFLDMLLMYLAKASPRYMVIAATNHANKIDDALMSRFRRKIYIGLPTAKLRKVILDMYIERLLIKKGYTSNLDTTEIANIMKGDSGRDMESFVKRLQERMDFEQTNSATQENAMVILGEMGKVDSPENENDPIDLDEELLSSGGK